MNNLNICCTRGCFNQTGEMAEPNPHSMLGCNKLDIFNWLQEIPPYGIESELVEIRFKNTRKGYYLNVNKLRLNKGDIVAVEASPGHDIGIVSLIGDLVYFQLKKAGITLSPQEEIKKIYRKAKGIDLEKWYQAIELENTTMLKARNMAIQLNLDMKIGDVEYQGDKTKAIFYYIADDRVDFRELIKLYAEEFRVRIEMKQIGARQEAGRIGGIGTCGRELCCSTWLTNFISVTTNSARYQEVSLNPTKLAGQCGKLKCCLNFELKAYIDAQQDFPDTSLPLEIMEGTAYHQKTDIFRRIMWYSFSKDEAINPIPIDVDRIKEIQALNKNGIKAKNLTEAIVDPNPKNVLDYQNPVCNDSITRFDETRKTIKFKKRRNKKPTGNEKIK